MPLRLWILAILPICVYGAILVDQSGPAATLGFVSNYFSQIVYEGATGLGLYGFDDFVVPDGTLWKITDAQFYGFSTNPTSAFYSSNYNWSVSFYSSANAGFSGPSGRHPFNLFFQYIGPPSNFLNTVSPAFTFATPLHFPPGHYYVSIVSLLNAANTNILWYWSNRNTTGSTTIYDEWLFVDTSGYFFGDGIANSWLSSTQLDGLGYTTPDQRDKRFTIFGSAYQTAAVLYNQTGPNSDESVFKTTHWPQIHVVGDDNGEVFQVADDFTVPLSTDWYVSGASTAGFYIPLDFAGFLSETAASVYSWTVEIYKDGGGTNGPGTLVMNYTGPSVSIISCPSPYIEFPPVHLTSGTYWVSIYPTISADDLNFAYVMLPLPNTTRFGAGYRVCDRGGIIFPDFRNYWRPVSPVTDLIFALYGSLNAGLTTSPVTSSQLTTQPVTTKSLTTKLLTTSPITTKMISTALITTNQLTTNYLFAPGVIYEAFNPSTDYISVGKNNITGKSTVAFDDFYVSYGTWNMTAFEVKGRFNPNDTSFYNHLIKFQLKLYSSSSQVLNDTTATPAVAILNSTAFTEYSTNIVFELAEPLYLRNGKFWFSVEPIVDAPGIYFDILLRDTSSGINLSPFQFQDTINQYAVNGTAGTYYNSLNYSTFANRSDLMFVIQGHIIEDVTSGFLTTQEMTTKEFTSGDLTTGQVTSGELTTSPLTSSPLTTHSIVTTQKLTTNNVIPSNLVVLYSQVGPSGPERFTSSHWTKLNGPNGTTLQLADDFVVTSPGWRIQFIQFWGSYFPDIRTSRASFLNWTIEIYTNDDSANLGYPYASPIFTYTGNAVSGNDSNPLFDLRSNSVFLNTGVYWISLYADINFNSMSRGWSVITLSTFSPIGNSFRMKGESILSTPDWVSAEDMGIVNQQDLQFKLWGNFMTTTGTTSPYPVTTKRLTTRMPVTTLGSLPEATTSSSISLFGLINLMMIMIIILLF